MSVLIPAAILVVAVLLWQARRGVPRNDPRGHAGETDLEELDQAEREVRDLPVDAAPDDEHVGDDWGPGATPGGRTRR